MVLPLSPSMVLLYLDHRVVWFVFVFIVAL